jgi:hypothetical protein
MAVKWDWGHTNKYHCFDDIRVVQKAAPRLQPSLQAGDLVSLRVGFETLTDASKGPLEPGDVAIVSKIGDRIRVKHATGKMWWYDAGAIYRLPSTKAHAGDVAVVTSAFSSLAAEELVFVIETDLTSDRVMVRAPPGHNQVAWIPQSAIRLVRLRRPSPGCAVVLAPGHERSPRCPNELRADVVADVLDEGAKEAKQVFVRSRLDARTFWCDEDLLIVVPPNPKVGDIVRVLADIDGALKRGDSAEVLQTSISEKKAQLRSFGSSKTVWSLFDSFVKICEGNTHTCTLSPLQHAYVAKK